MKLSAGRFTVSRPIANQCTAATVSPFCERLHHTDDSTRHYTHTHTHALNTPDTLAAKVKRSGNCFKQTFLPEKVGGRCGNARTVFGGAEGELSANVMRLRGVVCMTLSR